MVETVKNEAAPERFDVVIVGATPAGLMAAIAAARGNRSAVILERSKHLGGLPGNGLGATDIATRGATAGLFLEFVNRVKAHYVETYGVDSQQVVDCSDGYHFEPRVAEQVFEGMIGEYSEQITIRYDRQFDVHFDNAVKDGANLTEIVILNRETGDLERYAGRVFIDATYEGDLAAAAGAPYMLGREGREEYDEPCSGKFYRRWRGEADLTYSTGLGDNAIQSYNYRLPLTTDRNNFVEIPKPETYNRREYVSLIDDLRLGRTAGPSDPMEFDGIGRVVNMVTVPNQKVNANNQHAAFISTDLPEENWAWATASWDWRDRFAIRLRDYILGLLWFAQHDEELPEDFREKCLRWGLSADEFEDNDYFPRQVYVREARRIRGEYLFTAHDSLSFRGKREHVTSITASHYNLDSHACLKREPGRPHLDGFFGERSRPYTVPVGVMIPLKVDNLLTPVAASATHIGLSTLRMEPCWMELGQAAGVVACVSIEQDTPVRAVDMLEVQGRLLADGAVLIYFEDAAPGDDYYEALQFFGLRGFLGEDYQARLGEAVSAGDAKQWCQWAGINDADTENMTRGELLQALYEHVRGRSRDQIMAIHANTVN